MPDTCMAVADTWYHAWLNCSIVDYDARIATVLQHFERPVARQHGRGCEAASTGQPLSW